MSLRVGCLFSKGGLRVGCVFGPKSKGGLGRPITRSNGGLGTARPITRSPALRPIILCVR